MTRTITDDANRQSGSSPPLYATPIHTLDTREPELLGVEVQLHCPTHCHDGDRFPPKIGEPACPCLSGFMVLVWTNLRGDISLVEIYKHGAMVECAPDVEVDQLLIHAYLDCYHVTPEAFSATVARTLALLSLPTTTMAVQ